MWKLSACQVFRKLNGQIKSVITNVANNVILILTKEYSVLCNISPYFNPLWELEWIQSTAVCSLALLHCIQKNLTHANCCIVILTKMTRGCLVARVGLVDLLYVFAVYPPPPLESNRISKERCSNPIFCTGESLQTAVMDPWSESWGMTQFLSDVSEEGLWLIVHPHLVFPVSFNTLVYERPIFYSC